MPCTLAERNVLQQFSMAPNQQVRGDSAVINAGKIGVGIGIEPVMKKIVDPGSAKLFWRQADIVDNQQVDQATGWPGILIGRAALAGFRQQDTAFL